jgi:hypothetical protein
MLNFEDFSLFYLSAGRFPTNVPPLFAEFRSQFEAILQFLEFLKRDFSYFDPFVVTADRLALLITGIRQLHIIHYVAVSTMTSSNEVI